MIYGVNRLSHFHTERPEFQVKLQMMFDDDFRAKKCVLDPYTRGEAILAERLPLE